MLENIIKSIFWDPSEKKVKEFTSLVSKINKKTTEFENFSEEDIKKKTAEFKALFTDLDFTNEDDSKKIISILDDIKIEAFALVKAACKLLNWKDFKLNSWNTLTWNMIPYDVQLVGWLAIHEWNISEMKTWEWKTLVATLPAYLNCLTWNSVQIVTVNEYLASRDSEEMWVLFNMLWVTTWVIKNSQSKDEKQEAYKKDVIYATNNELWFILEIIWLSEKKTKCNHLCFLLL